ncbi:unnamed protein product [Nippostrongylus brasiliensis]|uniref:Inorganic phosphate cotransporter n=1 Tax=Nippostrongylus brasiliensis TaxID=27835 RepID=A0A158QX82_NIPBR|nr:unnamed protein product [Nippostrongylus brasiliensis]
MASYAKKAIEWIKSLQISVEPLMLVLAACNTARSIVTPEMSERKMMRVYPAPPGLSDKDLKKFYNKKMVIWDNNYSYVNLPIACIVGIMYGGYSDYHGRKIPLLIGIMSVLVENAMKILIWDPTTDLSLYWFYPTAVVTGIMGMLLATLIGAIFILPQKTPKQKAALMIEEEGQHENEPNPPSKSFLAITKLSFYSIYASLKIFVLSREGHRRLFLYLTFGANFLDQLVFGEEKSLIGTYTRLPPFNWNTSEYANYKSLRPIVQIVGMFFGLLALKKLFKFRDTFVICLAIGSLGISLFMIGLAQASWLIFASLAPGSLHGLLNPLTYTFLSCLIERNEIGKAFAISSIAQKLAGFAQTAILQNIYVATLSWYQGFVWLLMGGICVIAVGIYGFVHVVAKRENIGS